MSSSHQPEPWKLTFDDGGPEDPALRDKEGVIIADVYGSANGRRIVACVNACKGIQNEVLELDAPTFVKMLQQRTGLLATLQRAEAFIAGFEGDETQDGIDELLTEIRSALEG